MNLAETLDQKIIGLVDTVVGDAYPLDIEAEELVKLRCFCAIGLGSIFVSLGCALLYFAYDLSVYKLVLVWPLVLGLALFLVRKEKGTRSAFILVGIFLLVYWPLILSETKTLHGPVNNWLILMPMWFTFMGGIWSGVFGGVYAASVMYCIGIYFDFPDGHAHYFPHDVYIIEYTFIVASSVFISIGLYRISRHVYVSAENKNRHLHSYVGNLSHDLRNPIGSSVSYLDLLINDIDEFSKEEVLACLRSARSGMDLSLEMCEEVLDMSLIESGELSLELNEVKTTKLIEDVRSLVVPFCRRKEVGLVINNSLDENSTLMIDAPKLGRVLENLIVNAIKFSTKNKDVKFSVEEVGNLVMFSVYDEGMGMGRDVIDSIQNEKPIGRLGTMGEKTTGLGLKIVKTFLHLHNAELFIESVEEEYTKCYFYIKKGA